VTNQEMSNELKSEVFREFTTRPHLRIICEFPTRS